jgi:hypothetical protein
MKKPILLLKKELVRPIEQALNRIEAIRQRKMDNGDSIILEGLFVLAVSSFEIAIADTLRILLTNIPEKLDFKSEHISKEQLIDGDPLKHAIEIKVNAISYKNLPEIINYFTETTGIRKDSISQEELYYLIEIKASRNLLMHNNLLVNSFYRDSAGPKIRDGVGMDRRLEITQDYLFESLVSMRNILENFKSQLLDKYVAYTRVNAITKLFKYIFQTPVMEFDYEFEVDLERDVISNKKGRSRKESLSSIERLYYDIWLAHSHGNSFEFSRGHFYSLGDREKMAFFIKNIDLLKS